MQKTFTLYPSSPSEAAAEAPPRPETNLLHDHFHRFRFLLFLTLFLLIEEFLVVDYSTNGGRSIW